MLNHHDPHHNHQCRQHYRHRYRHRHFHYSFLVHACSEGFPRCFLKRGVVAASSLSIRSDPHKLHLSMNDLHHHTHHSSHTLSNRPMLLSQCPPTLPPATMVEPPFPSSLPADHFFYFAYGANMDAAVLAERGVTPRGVCRLSGPRLCPPPHHIHQRSAAAEPTWPAAGCRRQAATSPPAGSWRGVLERHRLAFTYLGYDGVEPRFANIEPRGRGIKPLL